MLARIGFAIVQWKARYGLQDSSQAADAEAGATAERLAAQRTGTRGETYAYWYLRRLGYIFIARNYAPARAKGEIDLIGFDGETLAFVEVRTRLAVKGKPALPELSITREKHEVLVRTAHYFLRERHLKECPVRFDVVAIDNTPGKAPIVRLHKAALSPRA
ncbi:MAG: YraN family protein [Candidatus Acidiferrum sp.]